MPRGYGCELVGIVYVPAEKLASPATRSGWRRANRCAVCAPRENPTTSMTGATWNGDRATTWSASVSRPPEKAGYGARRRGRSRDADRLPVLVEHRPDADDGEAPQQAEERDDEHPREQTPHGWLDATSDVEPPMGEYRSAISR